MSDKTKKNGVLVVSPYHVNSSRCLDVAALRAAALKCAELRGGEGSQAFMEALNRAAEEGHLSWDRVGHMMDLRQLDGILIPALVADDARPGQFRTVLTGALPALISQLNIAVVNEAYAELPSIDDQLVTDFDDPKALSFYALILAGNVDNDQVEENGEFPEIGVSEEVYEIHHRKNGRKIKFSRELFAENNIAEVKRRLVKLAQISRELLRKQSLRRVYDFYGSAGTPVQPYVLRRKGTAGASLYSTTANTPGTRAPLGTRIENNPLVSITNLEAARQRLNAMTNERGEKFDQPMASNILLVPDAVLPTALTILGSLMTPGVMNEKNPWGPQGEFRPKLLSSPVLDQLSTTAWHLGDFKRQFRRKWKQRPTFVELESAGQQAYLDRDVVYQARLSWDMEVGAEDYTAVVQSIAAATPPNGT
jgi:hypothetical protein